MITNLYVSLILFEWPKQKHSPKHLKNLSNPIIATCTNKPPLLSASIPNAKLKV